MTEAGESFACFGSTCSVFVIGDGAREAVADARRSLLDWHARFTRFEPASELSRLNADPRATVPVTPLMARLAAATSAAATLTGGLVDATLLAEIEQAGYTKDLPTSVPLADALHRAPPRRAARPHPRADANADQLTVDFDTLTVHRPPGLKLDSGGLAKGLFADALAETLAACQGFAVDCGGDVRIGGPARQVHVTSPFDGRVVHTWRLADAGVATSGIGRRSWLDGSGEPAHHLLDPATGRPAFTGVVQATAVAPTALEAEARAKAAVLAGPAQAADWLPHGGVVVLDDGRAVLVP